MLKEGNRDSAQEYFCADHVGFDFRSNYIESELKACFDRIEILRAAISYIPVRLAAGGDDEEDAKALQINASYNEKELQELEQYFHRLTAMNGDLWDEFERLECDDCWNIHGMAAVVAIEAFEAKLG